MLNPFGIELSYSYLLMPPRLRPPTFGGAFAAGACWFPPPKFSPAFAAPQLAPCRPPRERPGTLPANGLVLYYCSCMIYYPIAWLSSSDSISSISSLMTPSLSMSAFWYYSRALPSSSFMSMSSSSLSSASSDSQSSIISNLSQQEVVCCEALDRPVGGSSFSLKNWDENLGKRPFEAFFWYDFTEVSGKSHLRRQTVSQDLTIFSVLGSLGLSPNFLQLPGFFWPFIPFA